MSFSSPPVKYVTIATDVSCCSKFKIMTWACYIRYDGGVIKRSGQFKDPTKKTSIGETLALANALTIASSEILDWAESRVIMHCEVANVLKPTMTKSGNIKQRDQDRANAIINVSLPILDSAKSWELRDIKAHYRNWETSDNPAKYYMNRWCDIESRRLMKTLRSRKKKYLKSLC